MEPTEARPAEGSEEIRDFTVRREPIRFKLHGEVYAAPPIIGGMTLKRFAELYGRFGAIDQTGLDADGIEQMLNLVGQLFEALVPGVHGKNLRAAIESEEDPVDLQREALPILYYLLERYGLRPTQPSSSSPSTVTDGNSTAGALAAGSTPTDSTPGVS